MVESAPAEGWGEADDMLDKTILSYLIPNRTPLRTFQNHSSIACMTKRGGCRLDRGAPPAVAVADDNDDNAAAADVATARLLIAAISCSRSTAADSTTAMQERHGCMQHRSSHDRGGSAFVGVVGVGVVGVVGMVDVGVIVAVSAVDGVVVVVGGGVNGGGGVGVRCVGGADGVGAAGIVGAACEASAPHDGAATLPPSPIRAADSLCAFSAFSVFSASRTSLVAAPRSGRCSRSLASSGLTPISGSASHSPRMASRRPSAMPLKAARNQA